MKRKRNVIFLCLAMFCLTIGLLTACGNKETKEENKKASDQTANTDLKEVTPTQESVVVSSVAIVEILDALGVAMKGVPTSSYDLPESVADAVRIGNPMSPDLEVITSLEPDVIVCVDTLSNDLREQFELLLADTVFVNLSSYDGLKESIVQLGKRFGKETEAEEIVAKFETKEKELEEQIIEQEKPTVLIIFGAQSNFMVASKDTYVGDLVNRVGGINVIENAPSSFSPVDMEYLAAQDPDYILFMAHADPEESLKAFKSEFESNVAWQNFDAVKNDKVYALETGYFGMSANLLAIDALDKLVDILYEEK